MKRTTNGTEPTNSKQDAKRFANNTECSNDATADGQSSGQQHHFPHTSQSNYSAMLNLTPDVGSIEEGRRLFDILLRPLQGSTFMEKYWEKQPLRVDRKCPDFYKDLLSSEAIDKMLRQNHVEFTKNIDIQFKDGKEVITPIGKLLHY